MWSRDVSWAVNDSKHSCWGKESTKPNSTPAKGKKVESKKAVKAIWQIRYALQCVTELLICGLGLLNLSIYYSNKNLKGVCGLQVSSQWARSVVFTVESRFIFHVREKVLLLDWDFAAPPYGHSCTPCTLTYFEVSFMSLIVSFFLFLTLILLFVLVIIIFHFDYQSS